MRYLFLFTMCYVLYVAVKWHFEDIKNDKKAGY